MSTPSVTSGADIGAPQTAAGSSSSAASTIERDRRLASIQPGISIPGMTMSILVMVLGILLGVSNQVSDDTGLGLRLPALIAALLMVGQGVIGIKRSMTASPRTTAAVRGPAGAAYAANRPSAVSALPKPKASSYSVPVLVLALAVWLGLANLQVQAPTDLATYALISSFALFAIALSQLPSKN